MSTLHVQQIKSHLKTTFGAHVDMSDYSTRDPAEQEAALLSRSLAAFAVLHLADTKPELAAAAVTDGGQDNGIDAVYFDEAERALILVQSKWQKDGRGSVERGDIQKFITGCKDLINARFDRFNSKVQARQAVVEKALYSADSSIIVVVIYNGTDPLAAEQHWDITDFLKEMNDTTEIASSKILRQVDVHKIIASGSKGAPSSATAPRMEQRSDE